MIGKGFAVAKEKKASADNARSKWTPTISIKDGEVVPVVLNGSQEEEPYVFDEHTITTFGPKGKKFDGLICSAEEKGGCEGCRTCTKGDKRISKKKPKGAFSAVDMRWHGKKKVGEFNGQDKFTFVPLSIEEADPFEEEPPRKIKGYDEIVRVPNSKALSFSNMWILAMGSKAEEYGRKCKNCRKGRISVVGFKVGKKVVAEDPGGAEAVLECSKCADPEPWTLWDAPLVIGRTGADTSTSYSFELERDIEIPDWVKEYKPLDIEKEFQPAKKERFLAVLGIADDGKEEKEIEEEEEGDSLYNSAVTKKSGLKKKKKPSDEEELGPSGDFGLPVVHGASLRESF